MRLLLVEDEGVSASMGAAELKQAMDCQITVVPDPAEALVWMRQPFDLVVADMLYGQQVDDHQLARRQGADRKGADPRCLSGLAVLHEARKAGIKAVLWTNGEFNRRLHVLFAHQQLGCRTLCRKDAVGKLPAAVRAALSGHAFIDPVLQMYLTPPSTPSLHETFFASSKHLKIWRAMARGLHSHATIGEHIGYTAGAVRKTVEEMRRRLVALDPGCWLDGSPTPELVRYAGQNWQFFLDDTVREIYP